MRLFSKSLFLSTILTCAVSSSFADNFPAPASAVSPKVAAQPFSVCTEGGNPSCDFFELQYYNTSNPPEVGGAYFHCDSANVTTFKMSSVNSLITGFSSEGSLTAPGNLLDQYSFGAYRDPAKPTSVGFVRARDQNDKLLVCHEGIGKDPSGKLQKIFPGKPGVNFQ